MTRFTVDGAQEKFEELRAVARSECSIVLAVVELHAPDAWGRDCNGCPGTIQGDGIYWPEDCDTTQLIARQLGVDLA